METGLSCNGPAWGRRDGKLKSFVINEDGLSGGIGQLSGLLGPKFVTSVNYGSLYHFDGTVTIVNEWGRS